MTAAQWIGSRGRNYYIAHRGSGDVFPEHSMEAYQAAVQWGAKCMEISVGVTSDGVLVCMHDLAYDRTTNAKGKVAEQPSTILRSMQIVQPQLGPAWTTPPLPRVPLFEDVLRTFGGRVVLCVEAKVDSAYPAMMDMVERYGLRESVMVKAHYSSIRIIEAQGAGYPVFGYFGSPDETTTKAISEFGKRLDSKKDALIVPAYDKRSYLSGDLISAAVRTGIPVWVFPVHRRADAKHYFDLGVSGAVCASYGYVSTQRPVAIRDTWRSGAIASGEMTRIPGAPTWAPTWPSRGELGLAVQGQQHFLTMGQLCPLVNADHHYTVEFEASFSELPTDAASNLSLAFGHSDDAYYEHQLGRSDGYHAIMRIDGRLELYEHRAGIVAGRVLGTTVTMPRVQARHWMTFRLHVTPFAISWQRDGAKVLEVPDSKHRGGYLHVGRSAADGILRLRNFTIN